MRTDRAMHENRQTIMRRALPPQADAQMAAQQLLSACGAYSPIELLLKTNLIGYDDYRAWRCGRRAALGDALAADAEAAAAWLRELDAWARALPLEAQSVDFYGIEGHAGRPLTVARQPELDALLRLQFRRRTDRAQLDLFLDSEATSARNDLVAALGARDPERAARCAAHLQSIDPGHRDIADAQALIHALRAPPPASALEAISHLQRLEERCIPAARALLGHGTRDFAAPLWRGIGCALADAPFDPAHPARHASWAFRNGHSWQNARQAVQSVPEHLEHAPLVSRLAEAEWMLGRRSAATRLYFRLCWRWPRHFEADARHADFPAAALKQAWLQARDADLEPAIDDARWLPAWIALTRASLAHAAPRAAAGSSGNSAESGSPAEKGAPERAFDLLRILEDAGSDREDIDARRELQALHPGLFQRYLEQHGCQGRSE